MLSFGNKLEALIFPAIVFVILPFSSGEESLPEPSFMTQGREVNVIPGSNVIFPCVITNKGSAPVLWKSGKNVILFAENMSLSLHPRYSLKYRQDHMYNFTITNVTLDDEGEYICFINTNPPKEQITKLNVNIPPTIVRNSPEHIEADLHQNVTLNCSATGKPQPTIRWTKDGGKLPRGAQYNGNVLSFTNLERIHNGMYKCTATNGVEEDVSATITLDIEFRAVVVSNPHSVEHTGRKHTAELACAFDGNPPAEVSWYKGQDLAVGADNPNRVLHTQRTSSEFISVLKIKNPKIEDFGNYTCVVNNSLGSENATYYLTGVPESPAVERKAHGKYSEVYYAKWTVTSYDRPENYEILIREYPSITDSTKIKVNSTNDTWRSINVSAKESKNTVPNIYKHRYMIQGLQPKSTYEIRIRAKNFFGWSDFSDDLIFDTADEGHTPPPPKTDLPPKPDLPPTNKTVKHHTNNTAKHHTNGHHDHGYTPPPPTGPNTNLFKYGTDGRHGLTADDRLASHLNGAGVMVKGQWGSLVCLLIGLFLRLLLH